MEGANNCRSGHIPSPNRYTFGPPSRTLNVQGVESRAAVQIVGLERLACRFYRKCLGQRSRLTEADEGFRHHLHAQVTCNLTRKRAHRNSRLLQPSSSASFWRDWTKKRLRLGRIWSSRWGQLRGCTGLWEAFSSKRRIGPYHKPGNTRGFDPYGA